MRTLRPDTLAGRTVLALLAALVVSHVLVLGLYWFNRQDTFRAVGVRQAAERVVQVVKLVQATAAVDERARVLRSADGQGLWVMWRPFPMVRDAPAQGLAAEARALLEAALPDDLVRVEAEESDDPHASGDGVGLHEHMHGGPMHGAVLRVAVALPQAGWLNFVVPLQRPDGLVRPRFALPLLITWVVVALVSVWAVRRAARPLDAFAAAAERLGRDVAAAPMPETGPREVRAAARAFNDMQVRLKRFVDDRTQMMAAISHDLRTPITRLRLRAEFIDDDEQRAKLIADLDEMEAMIGATLAFGRDDAAREPRQTMDLAALLRELADDAVAGGGDAAYHGPERLVLTGGPLGLKRAFSNLVHNALVYGGTARLRLAATAAEAVAEIDDDGPGIPEAEMERMFAPFARLEGSRNRATGGTGLGLAVARSAVRAHGGDIALVNRSGGGLTVRVTLPLGGEGEGAFVLKG